VPTRHVKDLPDLIAGARALNPLTTPEDVVRAIWRLGSRRLWANLCRHIPVRDGDLPEPKSLGGNGRQA